MKVFIVGGTGYLGSVLVERFVNAGFGVRALARSRTSVERLREAGATPVEGSLADTGVLFTAAAEADAVVWAASDYAPTAESIALELAAVAALTAGAADAAAAPDAAAKPVVYTSTALVYGSDPADATEEAVLHDPSTQPGKLAAERIVLAAPGVTGIVIRAGLIFGRGGTPLITGLIQAARSTGVSTYVDEGANTWMPVHVDELADLYLHALAAPSPGVFNAVGTVPFRFRELAEAIGELTETSAVSIPFAVAQQNFGPMAMVLTSTSKLNASKARATFGWEPAARSLLEDVRSGSYANANGSSGLNKLAMELHSVD